MIKKLSLKFVLVFLVLVVSVFITSSCYAEDTTKYNDIGPLSSDGVKELTVTNTSTSKFYNGTSYSSTVSSWTNSYLNYVSNGTAKMLYFKYNGYTFCYLTHNHNSSFTNPGVGYMYKLTTYYLGFSTYGCSGQLFVWNSDTQNWHYTNGDPTVADTTATSSYFDSINFNSVVLDIYCANSTEDYIRYNSNSKSGVIIFDSSEYVPPASVHVTHEFQSDTSAKVSFDYSSYGSNASVLKYSLTGVELNTDLTSPIQLRNPATYIPRSNKFSC